MTKRLFICAVLCVLTCTRGSAQSRNTNPPAVQAVKSIAILDDRQKLGPGDRVTYRVVEDQDDPRSITITDSGDLEVPYLGLVHAAGNTSLQLAKEVTGLVEKQLYYQATVSIAIEVVNKTRLPGND